LNSLANEQSTLCQLRVVRCSSNICIGIDIMGDRHCTPFFLFIFFFGVSLSNSKPIAFILTFIFFFFLEKNNINSVGAVLPFIELTARQKKKKKKKGMEV
jgi:hypothetical protein